MRRYVLMSTVALMAFALPHYAQAASAGQTQPPRAAASPDTATQQFVRKAATGNIFEIQAAQTAEQKVSNPAYRDFAQMIITDHTNMGDRLKNVVKNVPGLQLPQALDQKDQQELQKLKTEGGATFERQYRANQIDDHQQDIKLFQNYADNGTNPQLKTWADQEVSMLQKHLDRAEALPMPQVTTGALPSGRQAVNQIPSNASPATTPHVSSAQYLVNAASNVVKTMQKDPQLASLLKKAKGLYIVPEFGQGALVVGAHGGTELVTVQHNGTWSDPAFYDMGGISVGPQIGAAGGSIAFLLMSQGAVNAFKSGNDFSLNANAGLSVVNYSAGTQASWGKGDIIMWTDTSGAYIGATISVTDINWDNAYNQTYYRRDVDMTDIMNGKVRNAGADPLRQELANT